MVDEDKKASPHLHSKTKNSRHGHHWPKPGPLSIITAVLSLYVLGALIADVFFTLPEETRRLLFYIDTCVCVLFFIDFCVRLYKAPNKLHFMRWGWIDLLASIPALDYARVGRVVRLIKIIRLLRAFRGSQEFFNYLFVNRAKGALTSVGILAILLVIFSSLAILEVERDQPNANIKTAEDAIWWAYVTITTVGYGDKYPVTTLGRLIAAFLMTAGVGLFGTFTAYVASWFVESEERNEEPQL